MASQKNKSEAICETAETLKTLGGISVTASRGEIYQEYRREWKERPLTQNPGEYPLHLDLESTSSCNLRCSFCWANSMRDKGGFFSIELAKKVFREGAIHGLRAVKFNLRGEPLVHPELHELVRSAKESGLVDVFFNTNGLLLTERKAIQLIEAGLDRLTISCEGYEETMYRKHRDGADFYAVVSNVKKMQELKQRLKVVKPLIRVQTVLLPDMIPVLDQYREFWEPIADEVSCTDYQNQNMENGAAVGSHPWACPFLYQRMTVLWDGTVLPCDRDLTIKHPLGNVKDVSIHEIWRGKFMEEMRQLHLLNMAHEVDICRSCTFRFNEIKKLK